MQPSCYPFPHFYLARDIWISISLNLAPNLTFNSSRQSAIILVPSEAFSFGDAAFESAWHLFPVLPSFFWLPPPTSEPSSTQQNLPPRGCWFCNVASHCSERNAFLTPPCALLWWSPSSFYSQQQRTTATHQPQELTIPASCRSSPERSLPSLTVSTNPLPKFSRETMTSSLQYASSKLFRLLKPYPFISKHQAQNEQPTFPV